MTYEMKIPDVTHRPLALTLLTAVAVCALALARHFLSPVVLETCGMSSMPAAALVSDWAREHPVADVLCTVAALLVSAVCMTRIMLQYSVVRSRNYVSLLIYIYIATFVMPEQTLVGALCGLVTCMGCLQAARSFRKGYRFDSVFRCGLLFGLLPLLYAPMMVTAVVVPLLMVVLRRRTREIACAVFGLVFPIACASYVYWLRGYGIGYMAWYVWQEAVNYHYGVRICDIPPTVAVSAAAISVATLLAVYLFYKRRHDMRARPYRMMLFFMSMLFMMLPSLFVGGSSAMTASVLAAPVSILVSYLISYGHNRLRFATYFLIAGSIIVSDIVLLLL